MMQINIIPTPSKNIFKGSGLSPEESMTNSEVRYMPILDESKHPCSYNEDGTVGICNCECFDEPHKGHPGIDYPRTGGIFTYCVGWKYPVKGFPTPSAVTNNNYLKEAVNSQIRFLSRHPWFFAGFLWHPIKSLEDWIVEQNRIFYKIMGQHSFQRRYYQNSTRAICDLISNFLFEIGIRAEHAKDFGELFATMLEYDNVHLWRVQDLASESTIEKLRADPIGELMRLLKILAERDHRAHLVAKYENYVILLKWIVKIPKFKKAFHKALDSIDFKHIQRDEIDYYTILAKGGYKFCGRTVEDRTEEWIRIHDGSSPPRTKVVAVKDNIITQGQEEHFRSKEQEEFEKKANALKEEIDKLLEENQIGLNPICLNSEHGTFPAMAFQYQGVSIITNFQ